VLNCTAAQQAIMASTYPYFNCSSSAASSVYAYNPFSTAQGNQVLLKQLMNAKCVALGLGLLQTCDAPSGYCDCGISFTNVTDTNIVSNFCLRKMRGGVFSAVCQNTFPVDLLQRQIASQTNQILPALIMTACIFILLFIFFVLRTVYYQCFRKTQTANLPMIALSAFPAPKQDLNGERALTGTGISYNEAECDTGTLYDTERQYGDSAAAPRQLTQSSDGEPHEHAAQELFRRLHLDDRLVQNELGVFFNFLTFFGMQLIRNRDRNRRWKSHRLIFFSSIVVLMSLLIWAECTSVSFAAIEGQLNQYRALQNVKDLLTEQIAVMRQPLNFFNPTTTIADLECSLADASFFMRAERNLKIIISNNSLLASIALFCVAALSSFMFCSWHWNSENQMTNALIQLQKLMPQQHRRCCKFANRVATLCAGLTFIFYAAYYCVLVVDGSISKENWYIVVPGAAVACFSYFIILLPSVVMASTFSFIAAIVRERMRAFLSLMKFAHATETASDTMIFHDVPFLLQTLNCPHSMSAAWQSLNVNSSSSSISSGGGGGGVGGGGGNSSTTWLRLQLQRLWISQLREANAMFRYNRAWLVSQLVSSFLFLVTIIVGIAYLRTYTLDRDIYAALTKIILLFCSKLFTGPLIALTMMALARWHIDSVCRNIEITLMAASAEADSSVDLQNAVCTGDGSLGELLVFCRISSDRAARLYGVPMDWMSLVKYVALLGSYILLLVVFLTKSDPLSSSRYCS